jgi:hypothetical protein
MNPENMASRARWGALCSARTLGFALSLSLVGCSPEQGGPDSNSGHNGGQGGQGGNGGRAGQMGGADDWSALPSVSKPDPELAPLGSRQVTYDRICSRKRGDSFAQALCGGGQRPPIRDLRQLLQLAGLGENRAFALTGNSTSLVAKSVSPINPRILVFPRVEAESQRLPQMTAVGFVRGDPFVEIVSRDTAASDYNFYLVSFEKTCSYTSEGCDLASQLTEEIEQDWTAYSIYDQEDLEPTSFDCLSCHRPGGHGTKRMLRMQELSSPWMHWFPQRFVQRTDSDRTLLAEFSETHKFDKQYGGIPIATISGAIDEGSAAQLEALVRAEGFGEQPNPFDAQIASEMKAGSSATWQTRYSTHLSGQAIAVPYPGLDVTDEAKRNAALRSYQDVVQGTAPRSTLLDLRDVFSADANEKLSFVPKPGADGKTVLLQMCARCHDGRSDPQLTKSRFNVLKLGEMSRAERDLAIARISGGDPKPMPPWRVGSLTAEGRQAAVTELQK